MKAAVEGQVLEVRLRNKIIRGATGEEEYIYQYQHVNPLRTLFWRLRYGPNGERITDEEAKKFEPA